MIVGKELNYIWMNLKSGMQLYATECTPFAFLIYATYQVTNRLKDKDVHAIIDSLNPSLRSRDTMVDGKMRVREFYNMTPEEAYALFKAIASINGMEDKLKKYTISEEEAKEEAEAKRNRLSSFRFSMCNILPGEEVVSLEKPDSVLLGIKSVAGPRHFTYKGKILSELRSKLDSEE